MKTTSLPRLIARAALIAVAFAVSSVSLRAQTAAVSTLRDTPSEIEAQNPAVDRLIERAETLFNQGKLNLKDNRVEQARSDFDKAVDTILESGINVRSNPRLQKYYLELVENIYRIEVPLQAQPSAQPLLPGGAQLAKVSDGGQDAAPPAPAPTASLMKEQKFEPSPLDELSKLVLTEEEKNNVTPDKIAEQEEEINALDFKFRANALIQQYINYYQGRGRSTMESGLRRSGQFMTLARRIFREEGVPEDIAWLGQVESAWRPTARSWAAASGLWQFIPGTGSRFGLRQNAWVDERNSFEKATRASARYLKWLSNRYNGNWELAIGAYNTGEGNIDRAIGRAGAADFWRIYPYIAQETRNYVPNILAVILISKNPERYGFGGVPRMTPIEKTYDVVKVPSSTSLQLIASLTDTSVDYLRSINPELRRDVTPPGEAYAVRVPGGRGNQFVALLKRIPMERRTTGARTISVAPGEDLASVAARTGTSVAVLQQWNNGVDLKSGGRLVVPSGSSIRLTGLTRTRGNNPEAAGSSLTLYRAKAGETIAQIAPRYGASVDEVARLNMVGANDPLTAGREIRIPAKVQPASAPARPSARRR